MPTSIRGLAFEVSRASLDAQSQRLSNLRTGAGTLLAAASIAGSFLATKHGDIDTTAALAIVAYVSSVGAAVFVLLPHDLFLGFRGSVINELSTELGDELDPAYEAVTEWLEDYYEDNRKKLKVLARWYTASCVALGAEVILWTLSVTDTL